MKARVYGIALLIVIVIQASTSWGFIELEFNSFFGIHAGTSNTTGLNNSFFGNAAGSSSNGNNNSFFGSFAGSSNSADNNSFFGYSAGYINSGGINNSFFGNFAGQLNSTGNSNSFVGNSAGQSNTTGSNNSYFGDSAGRFNATGINNSFFGNAAGSSSIGNNNSFFGDSAGYSNAGDYNSFFGTSTGYSNQSGGYNSFVGYNAGYYNTTGDRNSFFGTNAGVFNDTGNYNSFFGNNAGFFNTSGEYNTAIGFQAGNNNQTGSNNVFIGRNAGYAETGSNKLYIDNGFTTSPLIYGDFSAGTLKVNGTLAAANFSGNGAGLTNIVAVSAATCTQTSEIGSIISNSIPRWNGIQLIDGSILDTGTAVTIKGKLTVASVASVSDERYKQNIKPLQLSLDKLTHLTGISYDWKTEEFSGKGFTMGRQIGLIAQEVQKVLPELVVADEKGYLAIAYDKLVPVLIEAVKEQQESIKQKDSRIEKLEKALELMELRLTSLESQTQKVAFVASDR